MMNFLKRVLTRDAKPTAVTQEKNGLQKPTAPQEVSEMTRQVIPALLAVSKDILVAGVSTAVNKGVSVIGKCDEHHAQSPRARELKDRVRALLVVLVAELAEKKEEAEDELKNEICSFGSNLAHIEAKLDEIASPGCFCLSLFKKSEEKRVHKCTNLLDGALGGLQLIQDINYAERLHRMETQIVASYEVQRSLAAGPMIHMLTKWAPLPPIGLRSIPLDVDVSDDDMPSCTISTHL